MSEDAAGRAVRGGLWRHHDFRVFWIGETTSNLGSAVSSVALPLVAIDDLHASALLVTLLRAGTSLPWLILGLPAGGWVDRVRRRPLMLICDAVSFAAFASVPVAAWLGLLGIVQLLAVAVIAGSTVVFFDTAYRAYVPCIIDASDLVEGNAKLTGSASVTEIAGPGLGGAIVQLAGAAIGLLANAISFAISFICLTTIHTREQPTNLEGQPRQRLAEDVREGLRFVARDPFLRPLLFLGMPINFFLVGISSLTAVFLVRAVGIGPGLVGVVFAAESAGGVLGAIIAKPLARRFGSSYAALGAISLCLPFALLLPLTTRGAGLLWFIAGLFIVDGGLVTFSVLFGSFLQTYVPGDMLGRVGGSTAAIGYIGAPLGAITAGALTELLGVRITVLTFAIGTTISGLLYLRAPMRSTRAFPDRRSSVRTAPDNRTS